jgi:hypothetical protein
MLLAQLVLGEADVVGGRSDGRGVLHGDDHDAPDPVPGVDRAAGLVELDAPLEDIAVGVHRSLALNR